MMAKEDITLSGIFSSMHRPELIPLTWTDFSYWPQLKRLHLKSTKIKKKRFQFSVLWTSIQIEKLFQILSSSLFSKLFSSLLLLVYCIHAPLKSVILRTRLPHAKHSQSGLWSPIEALGLSLILALQRQMLFLVACCWFVGLVFNSTKV